MFKKPIPKKAKLAFIFSTVCLIGAVACYVYLNWDLYTVDYLKDEPVAYPDGILEVIDGKTYGYSDDCDVYRPEHVQTEAFYFPERTEWAAGIVYINGHKFTGPITEKDLGVAGYDEIPFEEDETEYTQSDVKKFYNKSLDSALIASYTIYGTIYALECPDGTVTFIDGLKENPTRLQVKRVLGEPKLYSRYSEDYIHYSYYDGYGRYYVDFDLPNDNKGIKYIKYTWSLISREEDTDGDGIPEIPDDGYGPKGHNPVVPVTPRDAEKDSHED